MRNIVDTSVQFTLLAAEDNNISLGRLIQAELGLEVDKGEQKSNWLKRPLTEGQKEYAANDVLYLFELTDRLSARLAELGRAEWAEQENLALEAVRYGRDDPRPWSRNAAKYKITSQEMPIFRELYMLRDAVARQLDRPPYHILSNDRLAELARNPIETALQLRGANGLHPELKRSPYAEQLLAIGTTDLAPDAPLPPEQRKFPFRRRLSGPAAARADARENPADGPQRPPHRRPRPHHGQHGAQQPPYRRHHRAGRGQCPAPLAAAAATRLGREARRGLRILEIEQPFQTTD